MGGGQTKSVPPAQCIFIWKKIDTIKLKFIKRIAVQIFFSASEKTSYFRICKSGGPPCVLFKYVCRSCLNEVIYSHVYLKNSDQEIFRIKFSSFCNQKCIMRYIFRSMNSDIATLTVKHSNRDEEDKNRDEEDNEFEAGRTNWLNPTLFQREFHLLFACDNIINIFESADLLQISNEYNEQTITQNDPLKLKIFAIFNNIYELWRGNLSFSEEELIELITFSIRTLFQTAKRVDSTKDFLQVYKQFTSTDNPALKFLVITMAAVQCLVDERELTCKKVMSTFNRSLTIRNKDIKLATGDTIRVLHLQLKDIYDTELVFDLCVEIKDVQLKFKIAWGCLMNPLVTLKTLYETLVSFSPFFNSVQLSRDTTINTVSGTFNLDNTPLRNVFDLKTMPDGSVNTACTIKLFIQSDTDLKKCTDICNLM